MACVSWCDFAGGIPPKTDVPIVDTWEIELSTFSNWFRNEVLGIFEGLTPTIPSTLYVRLHSSVSSAASAGAELVGDGYAPVTITFERVSDIKRWNPNEVSFGAATGAWSVASLTLWDAASGGNYYAFGNLETAIAVDVNKTIVLQANKAIIGMGELS